MQAARREPGWSAQRSVELLRPKICAGRCHFAALVLVKATNLVGGTISPLSIRVWTSQRGEIDVSDAHLEIRRRNGNFKVCVIATSLKTEKPIWCDAGPASTKKPELRQRWSRYDIEPRSRFQAIEAARDYAELMVKIAPLSETLTLHSGLQEQNPPQFVELVSGSYAEVNAEIDGADLPDEIESMILAASSRAELEALGPVDHDELADLDLEGARSYRLQQFRERSDGNRLKVLERKGHACEVCGFDFAKQFQGFAPSAHVHHKNPLALGERRATSIDEFAVLCAPCHTAAHMGPGRQLSPRSIQELQRAVRTKWPRD